YGLAFVALGAWVLLVGADAVTKTLLAGEELENLAHGAPDVDRDQMGGGGIDPAGKGVVGVLVALVGVAAGCFIVQGVPLCLAGLGVVARKNWGRVLALLLAFLIGIQGLALLGGSQNTRGMRLVGGLLAGLCVLSFVALLNKRASQEFSRKVDGEVEASEK